MARSQALTIAQLTKERDEALEALKLAQIGLQKTSEVMMVAYERLLAAMHVSDEKSSTPPTLLDLVELCVTRLRENEKGNE